MSEKCSILHLLTDSMIPQPQQVLTYSCAGYSRYLPCSWQLLAGKPMNEGRIQEARREEPTNESF
jgi:hypothetical protein